MDSVLRDIEREKGKMQAAIDNLHRHYDKLHNYVSQYIQQTTTEWARLVASHPKALLLVVETTRIVDEAGYATTGDSEPIRLTTLSLADGEIWDQLIRPTYSRQVSGSEYHGLTMTDLTNTPCIDETWENIVARLEDRHIILFGADWARNALRAVKQTHALDGATCLHNKAKEYYGEFYELPLEKILAYQGIDKKREDLRDSRERILMLHQVICNLATGMAKQTPESETTVDLGDGMRDLEDHPF
jgi:hypothetical protein